MAYYRGNILISGIEQRVVGTYSEELSTKIDSNGGSITNTVVTFTSNDNATSPTWQNIPVMISGEKQSSAMNKISSMFQNVRYLNAKLDIIQQNFQDGVDTLYNACVKRGATPSGKTPSNINDAINSIVNTANTDGTKSVMDNLTADATKVLAGYTATCKDGIGVEGTMPNHGRVEVTKEALQPGYYEAIIFKAPTYNSDGSLSTPGWVYRSN